MAITQIVMKDFISFLNLLVRSMFFTKALARRRYDLKPGRRGQVVIVKCLNLNWLILLSYCVDCAPFFEFMFF